MTIAFIGHKHITVTNDLIFHTYNLIETLIKNENADTFLFGSNSQFNDFCYDIVTELKERFPHIQRIYIRAEREHLSNSDRIFLLTKYEDTFYPPEAHNADYKTYIKRNQIMVDMCDTLIIYYDPAYIPSHRSSGTQIAIKYATQKQKTIINILED